MNKIFILLILLLLSSVVVIPSEIPATEVRAVWLTTNYGLDWPTNSKSQEDQKKELISILDSLKKYNFNTVMFQVRARGEVFYKSVIEPMSSLIAAGDKGEHDFDPLAFAVEEAHKRGLECHAWIVTYPLGGDRHVRSLGSKSVTKKNPTITKKFKGEWFLDPGNPRTDDYLISIVEEIVNNYDVDGIHFDYIRYPDNRGQFPDDGLYRIYGKGLSRADWRRDNISRFITKVYDFVKKQKPWVQVSSSPLGRYRTINDRGRGWTAFETVFQDAGKWMKLGKHDALYPMMYYKDELFYPYLDDWKINSNERILVPGLGAYQIIELGWSSNDILDQVEYARKNRVDGQAFFRTQNILSNSKGILDSLNKLYEHPAKLPPMKWLSDSIPNRPNDLRAEKITKDTLELKWEEIEGERVTYNVYRSVSDDLSIDRAENIIATGLKDNVLYIPVLNDEKAYYYYVTTSDSFHNESDVSIPAFFYHSETIK